MSHTPPPLPPAQNDKDNTAGLPSAPSKNSGTGKQLPEKTVQPANIHPDHTEEIDYEVVTSKKTNPWLWAIPIAVILLLIGGGIYAYFYMQKQHEEEQQELREEQEAEEQERLEREKEIADSIAYQDSLRLNFTSPDLAMFNLRGHVKSVLIKRNGYDGYSPLLLQVFENRSLSFDQDGNFSQFARDLDADNSPDISRSGDYVSNIRYTYGDGSQDSYSFLWSGNRISGIKNYFSSGSYNDSYTAFDSEGNPTSITESYSCTSDYDSNYSNKRDITYTIYYSEPDEYGNWTKAQVSGTGSGINKWTAQEESQYWNGYYWDTYTVDVPKSETENINFSYTLTRYIDYYDY